MNERKAVKYHDRLVDELESLVDAFETLACKARRPRDEPCAWCQGELAYCRLLPAKELLASIEQDKG